MDAEMAEIIEWLRSPEGEAWSRSRRATGSNLYYMQRAHGDLISEVFMPGMFGVRAG